MRWHVVVEACLLCVCICIAYGSNDERLQTVLRVQYLHMVTLLLCAMNKPSSTSIAEHIRTYSLFSIVGDLIAIGFTIAGAAVHLHEQTPTLWILRMLYIFNLLFCIAASVWHIRALREPKEVRVDAAPPASAIRPTLIRQPMATNLRIRIPALKIRGL